MVYKNLDGGALIVNEISPISMLSLNFAEVRFKLKACFDPIHYLVDKSTIFCRSAHFFSSHSAVFFSKSANLIGSLVVFCLVTDNDRAHPAALETENYSFRVKDAHNCRFCAVILSSVY